MALYTYTYTHTHTQAHARAHTRAHAHAHTPQLEKSSKKGYYSITVFINKDFL